MPVRGILNRSDTRLYLGVTTKPQPQSVTSWAGSNPTRDSFNLLSCGFMLIGRREISQIFHFLHPTDNPGFQLKTLWDAKVINHSQEIPVFTVLQ
jgi:hypothetical protein